MKNHYFVLASLILMCADASAQRLFSRTARIAFSSEAALEHIEAVNDKATTVFDASSGAIQWSVLMKGFRFEKALMEEHFNENYVESSTYPKSVFKGSVINNDEVDLTKDGTYPARVKGVLELHGVSKEIETDASFKVNAGKVNAMCAFEILLSDYDIEIPNVVKDNISNTVSIDLNVDYEPMEK